MNKNLILLLFTLVLISCNNHKMDYREVKTNSGLVAGTISEDGVVKIFKGIPFAASPVGELRWKAPQPALAWDGVRSCIENPPSAMQRKPQPFFCWSQEFLIPEEPISEDCLYLNVWTSAEKADAELPVIVWIHGGGFTGGSGTVPLYDGEVMARKGVVFVTINYRLGIFGFFAHPDLSGENDKHISGNYGILDQIFALQWVKENIAAFGGNPDCVTIAGQSAGAMSVNVLVASPLAKGLFHRAIAQSGGMFGGSLRVAQPLANAEQNGKATTDRIGASVADLRKIPADSLLKIAGFFSVNMDNEVVPPIAETFAQGKQNDVSLISGWNADDGVSFELMAKKEMYIDRMKMQFGDKTNEFLQYFPAETDAQAIESQKLYSQLSFGWNNFEWAKRQAAKRQNSAYLYYFKRVPPGEPNYGAFHSAEFAYALHTLRFWDRPFTQTDYDLQETMSDYWVNFARTGNPNGKNLPEWKAFDENQPEVISLGDNVKSIPLPFQNQLKFLDKINQQY